MKLNNPFVLIAVLIVFVAGFYNLSVKKPQSTQNNPANTLTVPAAKEQLLESQSNTEGGITVKVTPNLSFSSWDFEVVLDTHSGSLDQDLVNFAELFDDKGNSFKPLSWEGDPPGGHHRKGVLKFDPVLPRPSKIELVIRSVGDSKERRFQWQLE